MPIRWPEKYAPGRVAVRVSNQIEIAAPPSAVWAQLVRAADWPVWYPNSTRVRIDGGAETLSPGVHFTWRTFGVSVSSTVCEFVRDERVAWDGAGLGLDVYHAWLIEGRPGGCWVLTEENQDGFGARTMALLAPRRMSDGHQLWLERLKQRTERS